MTKEEPGLIERINIDARLPNAASRKLLAKLQNEGLVFIDKENVHADSLSRIKLAVKAVSLGADLEQVAHLLCWQEFEEIAAYILKNYGYLVQNNVRFKHEGHRYEIDVVGCSKPLVVCLDCKHWRHAIALSALKKIVEAQTQRVQALVDSLPNLKLNFECTKWSQAKFFPVILSLMPSAFKFYYEVPIVPILQLQDFLYELPLYTGALKYFTKAFTSLSHNF